MGAPAGTQRSEEPSDPPLSQPPTPGGQLELLADILAHRSEVSTSREAQAQAKGSPLTQRSDVSRLTGDLPANWNRTGGYASPRIPVEYVVVAGGGQLRSSMYGVGTHTAKGSTGHVLRAPRHDGVLKRRMSQGLPDVCCFGSRHEATGSCLGQLSSGRRPSATRPHNSARELRR